MVTRAEDDRRQKAEEENFVVEGDNLERVVVIGSWICGGVLKDDMHETTHDHSNGNGDSRLWDEVQMINFVHDMLQKETT